MIKARIKALKIIDSHVHYSKITSFEQCAWRTSYVDYSQQGYKKETSSLEVIKSICMGLVEKVHGRFPDKNAKTPMIADLEENMPEGMYLCLGINPHTLTKKSLDETEDMLKNNPRVVGMKIYAGYYHVDINDPLYTPVYKLAETYDKTIVIHTGETFSERGLLKYSHPLCVDELAVTFPKMRIVACHMGAPWIFDAVEVAAKNPNVYVDISGLLVGDTLLIARMSATPLLINRYKEALIFLDNYDKILYGSDWPLVPMNSYIDFCKEIIPPEAHAKVFFENAIRVYRL